MSSPYTNLDMASPHTSAPPLDDGDADADIPKRLMRGESTVHGGMVTRG
jgi:hypothetical protein